MSGEKSLAHPASPGYEYRFLTATYGSDVLKRQVSFRVFLPVDNTVPNSFSYANPLTQKYRTLYLLHGLTSDAAEWLSAPPIKQLAKERNLAVVMPNGENSFYVPGLAPNSDYGQYAGQEIVEMSRRMFPLSNQREDTFIGGISMGGFGAVRNGLKYAETFSKVLSLSAAIHMFEFEPGDARRHMVCQEDQVMGDFHAARLTSKNPAVCLAELENRVSAGASFSLVGKERKARLRSPSLRILNVREGNYFCACPVDCLV